MLNADVSIRDFDGQAVVALRGELNLADTPSAASHLIAAVTAYGPSVIVDLAGLEGIGYSGLSVLLRVRKWTRQSGGDLPLAAPQPAVRRILEATGLIDVFSVHPSVEEAARSARHAQTPSPTVPQQPRSARVTRPCGWQPRCRAARQSLVRQSLVRPLPSRAVCRPRHIAREACVKWRSPGGTTAA
jgi:anti-sigma B factor antagonist